LRIAATCPSRPLRVGVKNVEWDRERCHTLYRDRTPCGEDRSHREASDSRPHPIRTSWRLPSPCHERDRRRAPVKACGRCHRPAPRVAERRGQRARIPLGKGSGRPFASVIAATPRALNPMFHQPRRTRASRGKICPSSRRKNLGWANREISLSLESDLLGLFSEGNDERLGALPSLESKPSKDSRIPRRRCPRTAPLPSHAFGVNLLAWRSSSTRASSTSRCRTGEDPSAETPGPPVTVCPSSPPALPAIGRSARSQSLRRGSDPAKGAPCHRPEVPSTEWPDPVRIGQRGATPLGVTHQLRTQSSNTQLWTAHRWNSHAEIDDASRAATPPLSAFFDHSGSRPDAVSIRSGSGGRRHLSSAHPQRPRSASAM